MSDLHSPRALHKLATKMGKTIVIAIVKQSLAINVEEGEEGNHLRGREESCLVPD